MPQRYSGILTKSKCAQPLASTDVAVRRYTSSAWKPSGPISRHHARKPGCHCSSARCRRRSAERSTLFGIFSFSDTLLIGPVSSRPPPVELRPLPRLAIHGERALLAGRVRARENPVLPCREPSEDLRLDGLGADEAKARLHARERVRVHRGALLDRQAHLIVPVELVGRE